MSANRTAALNPGARICRIALLASVWPMMNTHGLAARSQSQPPQTDATLSGHVVTGSNQPASNAHVVLRSLSTSAIFRTSADVSGHFAFRHVVPGPYIVRSDLGTADSQDVQITVSERVREDVIVVLKEQTATTPAVASGSAGANPTMEFSDKPNFAVAGVTDWTAVGGHGSDATLRTSEDLTRETLALKATAASAHSGTDADRTGGDHHEDSLRAALKLAPQSYAAHHDLGIYYLREGRFRQALPLLEEASRMDSENPHDEYEVALACRGMGDLRHARSNVQSALSKSETAEFHELLGDLEERLGDPLSAVQHLQRATQLSPTEESYFNWASELLLHRAIWQAADVFAHGARSFPSSIRLKTGWGTALFGGALYEEAAQQLCEASDLDPAAIEPYLFLGKIASASRALPSCAGQKLVRFMKVHPENANAYSTYASFLLNQDRPAPVNEVESLFHKAVALDPKQADSYLQLGILSFNRRNYSEAITFFVRSIELDEHQAEAHYRLGVAYDRTGQSELAKQQFKLHDEMAAAQAKAVEAERRQVKQFLIVLEQKDTNPARL